MVEMGKIPIITVVDILSGQHLSGEKRTRAFDVLKLKMFIESLGQVENRKQ